MVPRASHRIVNDQSLGKWSTVMGASRPDREKLSATTREEHGLIAGNATHHASIGNVGNCDALREIGSLRLRLLSSHEILQSSDPIEILNNAGMPICSRCKLQPKFSLRRRSSFALSSICCMGMAAYRMPAF